MLFGLETLHLSPGVLGLVIGCGSIGAFVGAATASAVVRRIGPGRTTLAAFLLGGLAQLLIPLAPADPLAGAAFLIGSQLLGDGLITIYSITETSLRQQASRRKPWAVPRRSGRWLPASLRRSV
jgi:MFS family permease